MRSVKQCIEFLTNPNTHIRAFSRGPGGKGGRPGEETQKASEKKASAKVLAVRGDWSGRDAAAVIEGEAVDGVQADAALNYTAATACKPL